MLVLISVATRGAHKIKLAVEEGGGREGGKQRR